MRSPEPVNADEAEISRCSRRNGSRAGLKARVVQSLTEADAPGGIMQIRKIITVSAVLIGATTSAGAQSWPTRPMTMVAPFAAGGSTDAIARIVADGLSSQLQQPV